MPLYDYRCDQCGHRFEVRQGIREDPLTTCPQCGGAIRRVIHPVGIVFKGSGFYVTDSRGKSSVPTSARSDGAGRDKKEKKESPAGAESTSAASAESGRSASSAAEKTSPSA